MTRLLSKTFRSVKLKTSSSKPPQPQPQPQQPSSSSSLPRSRKTQAKSRSWSVYLILSTNHPVKTYVGVTTNFSRRLKQHNGELKGGAKASRAGRPWICACLIHGFIDRSEACEFESKWKSFSRKLPRKRIDDDQMKQSSKDSHRLLHHRKTALERVKEGISKHNDPEIEGACQCAGSFWKGSNQPETPKQCEGGKGGD
ncbi:hypothetical protein OIU78_018918 [Salix suchowensis]|nr:hypothetical protein OIU78_018918 [Salix suchowensis]